MQIPGLYILQNEKGRGVYTAVDIPQSSIIEVAPVIVIPKHEIAILHKTSLHDYYFLWGEDLQLAAIALGYGSLYNHSSNHNADFELNLVDNEIVIVAIQDIPASQEILINYHGDDQPRQLWFEEQ